VCVDLVDMWADVMFLVVVDGAVEDTTERALKGGLKVATLWWVVNVQLNRS
jgi:hypothetical protein